MNYHKSPLFTSKTLRPTVHSSTSESSSQLKARPMIITSTYEKQLNADLVSFPDPEAAGGVRRTTTLIDGSNMFQRMSKRNKFTVVGMIIFVVIAIIIGIGVAVNTPSHGNTSIASTNQTGLLQVPDSEMLTTGGVPRVTSDFEYPLPATMTDSISSNVVSLEATSTLIDGQSSVTAIQTTTTMTTQQTMSIDTIFISVTIEGSMKTSQAAMSVQSIASVISSESLASTFTTQETATTLITSIQSSQAPSMTSVASTTSTTTNVAQPTASPSGEITFCGAPGASCNF